ncbi:hypothetical protein [Parvularcula sp. IMCC14364]|uniref:hypothetical protein n=1 Tax=Parvularcula sp. IMCC14364 TaxID=3067902 RepID=UPI0027406D5F|nr:hypothetical protein [Parvularcula sp. IMCC14364]
MTYNKFANGGLYNQMGGNTPEYNKRSGGGAKLVGILLVIALLGAAGAGIWFMQ